MTEKDAEDETSSKKETGARSLTTMFYHLRELFFVFALGFTSYAALFNSLPKIGKPPPAVPFFSTSSVVADYYHGNINTALRRAADGDMTVVMYYAPWDMESQAARAEFEAAALLLHSQATFAAISCWEPTSECRHMFPKVKQFPLIVAYVQHRSGVPYRGPLTAIHLVKFLTTVLRPLHRVLNSMDLVHLISQYSAVVVGSFELEGTRGGAGFHTFYRAALRTLEKDPLNGIAFAVTTDRAAAATIEVEQIPAIRLFLWNETFEFPADAEYTPESVADWAWGRTHEVVSWVTPPNQKAKTLSPYLTTGPALLLFTPRNPLEAVNPMHSLLKEVALRYYNCRDVSWIDKMARYLELSNAKLLSVNAKKERACSRMRVQAQRFPHSVTVASGLLNRTGCDSKVCDGGISLSKPLVGPLPQVCIRTESLNQTRSDYSYPTSMLTGDVDERSAKQLLHGWMQDECRLMDAAQRYQRPVYPGLQRAESSELDGMACVNNRTLAMVALDSRLAYQFAEGLGLRLGNYRNRSVAVIVDAQAESQYVLSSHHGISHASLTAFIANHTWGELERHVRSSVTAQDRSVTRHRYPVRGRHECVHSNTESCVNELNSQTFHTHVTNTTKAVVVLYHTPYCALCRSVSHVFLLIARYLRFFNGLDLARVDGDNNDLPWQYAMDTYPSILFFPTFRKSDTRVFSSELPFTVRNLIHFILANLEPEAKIPAMVSLCMSFDKIQSEPEARKCKGKIQKESYEQTATSLRDIRVTLQRWRHMSPSNNFAVEVRKRRKQLIQKLSYFQNVHLLLGSVDRITRHSDVAAEIFSLYDKYLSYNLEPLAR